MFTISQSDVLAKHLLTAIPILHQGSGMLVCPRANRKNWPWSRDREWKVIMTREIISAFSIGRMCPFLVLCLLWSYQLYGEDVLWVRKYQLDRYSPRDNWEADKISSLAHTHFLLPINHKKTVYHWTLLREFKFCKFNSNFHLIIFNLFFANFCF